VKRKVMEFCGAFEGRASMRPGETPEQFAERVEEAMQNALDRCCKRLDVSVGVDFGDLRDNGKL
jgi:hypothetical protein